MNDTSIDLGLLTVFTAVVEASSFSKAGKRLGMAKGTVSRSIARLEELVGAELLHRTTHTVAPSTAGLALYERSASHLAALTEAVRGLPERSGEPSGRLRLTVPHDFGVILLPEVLKHFALRYPQITFDIAVTNALVDMVAEGFDAAIRFAARLEDSNLTARRLGGLGIAFYAAPEYLARRGRPARCDDDGHDWVLGQHVRRKVGFDAGQASRFACDDFLVAREILRGGGGVGLLPHFVADADERSGALERVDVPGATLEVGGGFHLVYASSGQVPRKLVAFRDFLLERFDGTGLRDRA